MLKTTLRKIAPAVGAAALALVAVAGPAQAAAPDLPLQLDKVDQPQMTTGWDHA